MGAIRFGKKMLAGRSWKTEKIAPVGGVGGAKEVVGGGNNSRF